MSDVLRSHYLEPDSLVAVNVESGNPVGQGNGHFGMVYILDIRNVDVSIATAFRAGWT